MNKKIDCFAPELVLSEVEVGLAMTIYIFQDRFFSLCFRLALRRRITCSEVPGDHLNDRYQPDEYQKR